MPSRGFNCEGVPLFMLSNQFLFACPYQITPALHTCLCAGQISFPLGLWIPSSYFRGFIIQCLMCESPFMVRVGARHVGQDMYLFELLIIFLILFHCLNFQCESILMLNVINIHYQSLILFLLIHF